jgi:glycosyltransferase involved in cell wall biosynthesis
MVMRVLYLANVGAGTGYARAAEDYCSALSELDVELEIQPILPVSIDFFTEHPRGKALFSHIIGLGESYGEGEFSHVIIHAQPWVCLKVADEIRQKHPNTVLIAYSTWETWPAPSDLCRQLERAFDLLIVPSRFCADAFSQGGFPVHRLHVLPHCFDSENWPEVPQRVAWDNDPFTFVWVGSWSSRKNPFGLLRAYLTEFSANESVILRMLTPSFLQNDIDALRAGAQLASYPHLKVLSSLSEDQYRTFFAEADCYVTATRGEGWDLPAFDAATMGLQVIARFLGVLFPSYALSIPADAGDFTDHE